MNVASRASATTAAAGGGGLPEDRMARLAARRAFVEIKLCFMRATAGLEGAEAERLRQKVRQADAPHELWLLRHDVFRALLDDRQAGAAAQRVELLCQLDSAFVSVQGDLSRR